MCKEPASAAERQELRNVARGLRPLRWKKPGELQWKLLRLRLWLRRFRVIGFRLRDYDCSS